MRLHAKSSAYLSIVEAVKIVECHYHLCEIGFFAKNFRYFSYRQTVAFASGRCAGEHWHVKIQR